MLRNRNIQEGRMAEGTGRNERFSIWFFVGVMTLLYGLVLLPYGAWEWFGGHEAMTVLHELHPTFWWGGLLTLFGGFYTLKFSPRRKQQR
jgi:hypothetical protein